MRLKTKLILVFLLLMTQVQAAGDAVNHVFQAGDVIKAEEVNANFQQLADRIDVIAQATNTASILSFSDFIADNTVTTRKYNVDVHQSFGSHDAETHSISRNGTSVTVIRKRYTGGESGQVSQCHRLTFDTSNTRLELVKREHLDSTCTTVGTTFDLTLPIIVMDGSMTKGGVFGGGFGAEITANSSTDTAYGNDISQILGTEDVTLTVNGSETTYTGCLKINRKRQFVSWGQDYQRTTWFCNGVGMVKMIETRISSNGSGSYTIGSRKRELYEIN